MVSILDFISEKLEEAEIPYEFGEWTQPVSYPYFVGSFDETDFRYEDNCTAGTFTLDGWARGGGAQLALAEVSDTVKKVFANLQEVRDNRSFFVRFGGSQPVPSGEEGLYKVTITLFTSEWEGE
ncbi:MAG: hypothetical protein LIO86_15375 [Lachnospiraceae bacterium]|nr:hypothetical protein [Lachnospiraceae bacterium]